MAFDHTFYLVFKKKQRGWGSLSVRVTERQPSLDSGEVSIRVTAALPDALFKKPLLEAKITVPADAVTPTVISSDVTDNIADVVRSQLGLDMKISVVDQEQS